MKAPKPDGGCNVAEVDFRRPLSPAILQELRLRVKSIVDVQDGKVHLLLAQKTWSTALDALIVPAVT